MTSLGVQITKRIKESQERTPIQAGKLLLHICIPLMIPLFIFQFAPPVKSATARKVADDSLSDIFFKI